MDERLRRAQARLDQQQRIQAMLATIEALLAGEMTRDEARAWTLTLRAENHDGRSPFPGHGDASAVFESLWNIDENTPGGEPWVREVDLRGYRRWLIEGETIIGTEHPMVALRWTIDELAAHVGGEPVRFWNHGLGWFVELRFCAPVSGRPFVAFDCLEHPGNVEVHFRREDIPRDALADLFETLVIDDSDVGLYFDLNPEELPQWVLWREDHNNNRFEIERHRCYAKAVEREHTFTARGHRQSYWVEPA